MNILKNIRNSRATRSIAVFMVLNLFFQLFTPIAAFALTSGPSQPEVQSFEPIGTSDMVELFSGDFTYNIPLFEVGGYPINISYHSGVSMDQEASWVGLGWNINPGVLTRNLRGVPDDFNGIDQIETTMKQKPNRTWGITTNPQAELFGLKSEKINKAISYLSPSLGISKNNYKGFGFNIGFSPLQFSNKLGNLNLGLNFDSQSGADIDANLSIGYSNNKDSDGESSFVGINSKGSINSRSGLKKLSFSATTDHYSRWNKIDNNTYEKTSMSYTFPILSVAPTYTPTQGMSFYSTSLTVKANVGGEILGLEPNLQLTGMYSEQSILNRTERESAFGYMYSHMSDKNRVRSILDFNREKDGSVNKYTPNLAIPFSTYDVFNYSAQGAGGVFRPHRSDIPFVYDSERRTVSGNVKAGIELGFGQLAHFGGNMGFVLDYSETGKWTGTSAERHIGPKGKKNIIDENYRPLFEPFYFKNMGELAIVNEDFFNQFGHNGEPVSFQLDNYFAFANITKDISSESGQTGPISHSHLPDRAKRNEVIYSLTNVERLSIGLSKSDKSYYFDTEGNSVASDITTQRLHKGMKGHHIGELYIYQPNGWRYIYGIPAYNFIHKEVSFRLATDNSNFDCHTGIVEYEVDDNTTGNSNGLDNYFNKKELPPYAHSFLLSAIVSPEYVDLSGDGPTPDDLGDYAAFKYNRVTDSYKWRTPHGGNVEKSASFDQGFLSVNYDQTGSYIYGEKEVWYLHRIETRTHIAEFYTSKRFDSRGVINNDGGIDENSNNALMKLDSIKLYSRSDLELNGSQNATPIKSVYFEYDYSLCPNVENYYDPLNPTATGGKLTLRKLYFKFGNSNKGRLNSYRFTYAGDQGSRYSDNAYNPPYNLKSYDRWANYKPNPEPASPSYDCDPVNGPLYNSDAPYTPQEIIPSSSPYYDGSQPNRTFADAYAVVWNLTEIDMPSGGRLSLEYEADDYAYVQDKRAMEMFKIVGFAKSNSEVAISNDLYNYNDINAHNNFMFVRIPYPFSSQSGLDMLFKDVKSRKDGLYFKALMKTRLNKTGAPEYEYIPGYCTVKDYGIYSSAQDYTIVWIELEPETVKDKDDVQPDKKIYNPLVINGMHFMRIYLNDKLYPGSNPKGEDESAILGLLSAFSDLLSFFRNENKSLMRKGYCSSIIPEKSFVRLGSPNMKKKGGGLRVKSIRLIDNWKHMAHRSNNPYDSFEYGQEYIYGDEKMSYGVASYEPMIGGEENPFRTPIRIQEKVRLAPDSRYFIEEPIGESLFPAPQVGYSKVRVKNLDHSNVNRTATGYSVNEFYTAKDFPTIVRRTVFDPKYSPPVLNAIFKFSQKNYFFASQGFSVELNDMHGKPRANLTYDESGEIISGVKYDYLTKNGKLYNEVKVCKPDGEIEDKTIGVDIEVLADLRSNTSYSFGLDMEGQADGFLAAIIPALIPTFWGKLQGIHNDFKSAVISKVVYRYGLLSKTTAYDFASEITTFNEVWDSETGHVLLTRTKNEFRDDVFNFTYPSHWVYTGMAGSYRNIGAEVHGNIIDGELDYVGISNIFVPGDELMVTNTAGRPLDYRLWVLNVDNDQADIINKFGMPVNVLNSKLTVVRSGMRNQSSLPVGSVTTVVNPLTQGNWPNQVPDVVNATATTYSDRWQRLCENDEWEYPCESLGCEPNEDLIAEIELLLGTMANQVVNTSNALWQTPVNGINLSSINLPNMDSYNSDADEGDGYSWFIHPPVTNTLTASIGTSYNSGCIITLTAPAIGSIMCADAYKEFWEAITDFSNLVPLSPDDCYVGEVFDFTIDVDYCQQGDPLTLYGSSTCYPVAVCDALFPTEGCIDVGRVANPYTSGIRGNWHPKESYQFEGLRIPTALASTNLRTDGRIDVFEPFWEFNISSDEWQESGSSKWIAPSTVTKRLPYGYDIENQDILGRFSSATYGYDYTLPTAVAQNARYNDIGFDGFEDYDYTFNQCRRRHFDFKEASPVISDDFAHTGKHSLKITGEGTITMQRKLNAGLGQPELDDVPYTVKEIDCAGQFGPEVNTQDARKFVLSYWLRETGHNEPVFDYPVGFVEVKADVNSVPTLLDLGTPVKSKIIEGWQQVECTFDLPDNADGLISISLKSTGEYEAIVYFDDIRVHPFDAQIQTYVYDPISHRLVAQLDQNNFATFYEYDHEGNLTRVKKETERGIVTIQESRQNLSIDK